MQHALIQQAPAVGLMHLGLRTLLQINAPLILVPQAIQSLAVQTAAEQHLTVAVQIAMP